MKKFIATSVLGLTVLGFGGQAFAQNMPQQGQFSQRHSNVLERICSVENAADAITVRHDQRQERHQDFIEEAMQYAPEQVQSFESLLQTLFQQNQDQIVAIHEAFKATACQDGAEQEEVRAAAQEMRSQMKEIRQDIRPQIQEARQELMTTLQEAGMEMPQRPGRSEKGREVWKNGFKNGAKRGFQLGQNQ